MGKTYRKEQRQRHKDRDRKKIGSREDRREQKKGFLKEVRYGEEEREGR